MGRGTLRVRIVGDAGPLQTALRGAGTMLGGFARKAALALGAATVGAVGGSIRAFANFDQAMTQSLAIMGDVSDTMRGRMSDAAREVGRTTTFSATEAAEAYFYLASAGMDAEQSIAALPQVAAFAQAGNFDLARATDLATDAQSALGLAADDAATNLTNLERVTDVLVGANTLANASVEEFSEALTNRAGAAMRAVNMDIEEGVAVLAVFADQGIKGSEAGTLLRNTLTGLSENARNNADAFEDLGIQVFDSEGEMRNMASIVGDLEGAFEGMSTEQREAALAQLGFNQRQRDGILALLGNSEALADYEEQLRDAGGTAQDVAENQLDTFWAQLGLLKDMFVDVGLSIGEALMPYLERFVEYAQTNIIPAIEGIVAAFEEGGWSAAVEEAGRVFATLWDEIRPHLVTAMEAIGDWITGTMLPFVGDKLGDLAEAFWDWAADADPDVGLSGLLTRTVEWVGTEFVPAVAAAAGDAAPQIGKSMVDALDENIYGGQEGRARKIIDYWGLETVVWFSLAIRENFDLVRRAFDESLIIAAALRAGPAAVYRQLGGQLVTRVREGIVEGRHRVYTVVSELRTRMQAILAELPGIGFRLAVEMAGRIAEGIGRGIGNAVARARELRTQVTAVVQAMPGIFLAIGVSIIESLASGIAARIAAARASADTARNTVSQAFANAPTLLLNAGQQIIAGLVRGIASRVGSVAQSVRGIGNSVRNAIPNAGTMLRNTGLRIVYGLAGGIWAGASSVVSAAVGVVRRAVNAARAAAGIRSPSRVFAAMGAQMADGMASGMDSGQRLVAASARDLAALAERSAQADLSAAVTAAAPDWIREPASPTGASADDRRDDEPRTVHVTVVNELDGREVARRVTEHQIDESGELLVRQGRSGWGIA